MASNHRFTDLAPTIADLPDPYFGNPSVQAYVDAWYADGLNSAGSKLDLGHPRDKVAAADRYARGGK